MTTTPAGPVVDRSGSLPQPRPDGWWRRNRWALAVLPVVLALAVVAAGDRVRSYWWEKQWLLPTTAAPGETVTFHQDVRDGDGGTYPVDVTARLDGVTEATTLPDGLELPPTSRALRVELTLAADPDVVVVGCRLAVRDTAGTRYEFVWDGWGASQPTQPCVPEDTTGPWPMLGGGLDEELSTPDGALTPRPPTWTVDPVVVVPRDVEIADVVLWWELPSYLRLPVPAPVG